MIILETIESGADQEDNHHDAPMHPRNPDIPHSDDEESEEDYVEVDANEDTSDSYEYHVPYGQARCPAEIEQIPPVPDNYVQEYLAGFITMEEFSYQVRESILEHSLPPTTAAPCPINHRIEPSLEGTSSSNHPPINHLPEGSPPTQVETPSWVPNRDERQDMFELHRRDLRPLYSPC